ncbi:sugar MFS transporter [Sphingomonas canadensis]|uniref:Sugar MFS transporter n=1 Tax=Sphingomonas canadensis TaxID=1219257 RepID=A0ABW3H1P0_9SPHN|nr:sugar MFS transporter [Sphingomonas canadensis]MCW3834714.1 sugar MFS transporter [Sphingomonas canadensis]
MAPPPKEGIVAAGTGARSYGPALTLLASLFFMWGFITVINNTLLPHLRSVFDLNYFQTTLIESTWFIGYLLASVPSALLIERIGYQRALTTGLAIMTAGSLGMILAAGLPSYWVTLGSLFTVSCGIALLQVAANPYVAVIGPPETSESRLTLVQAFNTTGDVLAIIFGQQLILARTVGGTSLDGRELSYAERMADAQATELPYLIVAIVLAGLAVAIAMAKLPELGASTRRASAEARKNLSLWKHRNLVFGCGAIALCVYAEIGVSSLFINFASQEQIANITKADAASYLAFFWGGMMVGRFAGAWIMRFVAPEKVLALFAAGGIGCALVAVFVTGPVAMYALMAMGLFISIMFPTIFALSIRGLGPLTEEGSGFLIMSIAGGALVFIQGRIADDYGLNWGFLLTAACCAYVLFYALWGSKPASAPQAVAAVD